MNTGLIIIKLRFTRKIEIKNLLLSQEVYVRVTYFHGPSPGNYRRRK